MSKKRFDRLRLRHSGGRGYLRGKSRTYLRGKLAGAAEEALRQRGLAVQVRPAGDDGSILIQVVDPAAQADYLEGHIEALAEALGADSVEVVLSARDFIVAPRWNGHNDLADEIPWETGSATDGSATDGSATNWPPMEDEPDVADPDGGLAAFIGDGREDIWNRRAGHADIVAAFIDGYRLGRLAGAVGDLKRYLVLGGVRCDGSFELRVGGDEDSEAVRARLRERAPAIAEALGAPGCRIGGTGQRITIAPFPGPSD